MVAEGGVDVVGVEGPVVGPSGGGAVWFVARVQT